MAPVDLLYDTYVAALQHDIVEVPAAATLVGVVRRPAGWFRATVDEDVPALGPPAALLDEFTQRHEQPTPQGMCDEGVHNAAWKEIGFAARYRDYLSDDEAAQKAVVALAERLRAGEQLVLVCFGAPHVQPQTDCANVGVHAHRFDGRDTGRAIDHTPPRRVVTNCNRERGMC